jgi:glycosyltransferase involved in cell wall biosynthesis
VLPPGVRWEFVPEPRGTEADSWYSQLHLWSARAYEALRRLYPGGGPNLVEFPDYLGEACVTTQAAQTLDPALRNTRVCIRAYTTAEICAVLDGHLGRDRDSRYTCEIERFALRHADNFLWPGGGVLATYREFYGAEGVAEGIELPHVTVPRALAARAAGDGSGGGRLSLLYVGRLERRKGVQNLVRAATALPGDDWKLTLVGGDTPTAPLGHSMRAQLELMIAGDPRIELVDRVPRTELEDLYRRADVVVSPSLWECWPNTILEAFEQNRPVLATPVGGHLGMVEPGVSGWLAEGTSAEQLGDAIERLLAARGEPAELAAANGPRRRFEQLTAAEPVVGRYLELAAEPPRARRSVGARTSQPLVSVVVPYFEMDRFVEETLASVAAQTYPAIETIVVNDGSLRPEDAILQELAGRYPITVVTQPNSGLGQARNLGIGVSRGRYVLPFDPDDLMLPGFVERCVDVLEARPDLGYVTAWSAYVDEAGVPMGEEGYRPFGNTVTQLRDENLAGSAMALMRRELFEGGLRYSPDMTSYEDWLLYLQLKRAGHVGHVIPETMLRYRVRRRSMLRSVGRPRHDYLMGEISAHDRESEVRWTPSSA